MSVAHEPPVVGVLSEVKELAFSAISKNRVSTSLVSASVTEARTLTLVSSVYPSLAIAVEASSLSWVGEVGEAGSAFGKASASSKFVPCLNTDAICDFEVTVLFEEIWPKSPAVKARDVSLLHEIVPASVDFQ